MKNFTSTAFYLIAASLPVQSLADIYRLEYPAQFEPLPLAELPLEQQLDAEFETLKRKIDSDLEDINCALIRQISSRNQKVFLSTRDSLIAAE